MPDICARECVNIGPPERENGMGAAHLEERVPGTENGGGRTATAVHG
jgi:hypothetical protein